MESKSIRAEKIGEQCFQRLSIFGSQGTLSLMLASNLAETHYRIVFSRPGRYCRSKSACCGSFVNSVLELIYIYPQIPDRLNFFFSSSLPSSTASSKPPQSIHTNHNPSTIIIMHTKITTVTAILLSLLPSITLAAKDGEPVFNIRSALVNKDSVSVSLVRIEESPDQNLINCKIEGLGFQSATQLDLPCTGEQTETRYLRAWVQLPRRIAGGPNEAYPAFHIYGVNFIFEAEG